VQGRLGIESGDVTELKPGELEPHPKNAEIYGDTETAEDLPETFIESIREKGVLEPLVITDGKQIISGHRRWLAAKHTELDRIPVRKTTFDDNLTEREALVEFNRQREKTPGQVVNEFEEMLAIEQERAAKRRQAAQNNDTADDIAESETFPEQDNGEAREKAAEKVNADVSGRTLEKGLDVKEKAESGDETAQREWEKLQDGDTSFHRAKKNVEKSEAEDAVEEQRDTDTTQPTVHEADALSFIESVDETVDLLLTDPPYSTDVDDVTDFARSWVPDALEIVAADGFAFIFVGAYPDELQSYLNVIEHTTPWSVCQVLVWTYRNTLGRAPNDRYKLNWQAILYLRGPEAPDLDAPKTSEQWAVQEVNAPDGRFGERHHKWEKPTELADRLIRHTTAEDDTVLDPFAGTGTFALTAAELGRGVLACDHDSDMLEIAAERGCLINE